ncbi:MAG TPA: transporter [Caulobacterales bacterium]|nr:transporter [Caulobacterales bacterium]
MRFWAVFAGVLALSTNAFAEEPAFVTGRPGQTESPIAVPKGYFQIETELGGVSRDKAAGVKSTETDIASTSFRYGIADGADVELVVSPYVRTHENGPGFNDRAEGFGDVTLRARRTIFGESGEGPSFALIGFVTLPTARDGLGADKVEGGLIATGVAPLSAKASLTLTLGAADIHDGKYEGDVYGGANVSFAVTDKAGVYIEAFADKTAHGECAATIDVGGTYLTGPTTQFDAGVNIGVTDAADDMAVFAGWSHRF